MCGGLGKLEFYQDEENRQQSKVSPLLDTYHYQGCSHNCISTQISINKEANNNQTNQKRLKI